MRLLLVTCALLLLGTTAGSCQDTTELFIDTVPVLHVAPPLLAEQAWAYDLACSGLHPTVRFEDINWWVADLIAHSKRHNLEGYWGLPDSSSIVIDLRSVNNPSVLAHEILHYMRQEGGHPDDPFKKCGV